MQLFTHLFSASRQATSAQLILNRGDKGSVGIYFLEDAIQPYDCGNKNSGCSVLMLNSEARSTRQSIYETWLVIMPLVAESTIFLYKHLQMLRLFRNNIRSRLKIAKIRLIRSLLIVSDLYKHSSVCPISSFAVEYRMAVR